MKSKYITPMTILLFCLFLPCEARADGISIPILLGGGLIVFVSVIIFITLIESVVIFKLLRLSFCYGFKIMLIANILSMLSGIPVKIINMILYVKNMPNNLYDYFQTYPYLVGIGTLFYFIVTVVVEYLYLQHVYKNDNNTSLKELFKRIYYIDVKSLFLSRKGGKNKGHRKQLIKSVILVNLVSYAFMVPLNYYVTRPQHDIKKFTKDSSWAQQPASPIYYIDHKTKRLAMIMTDGSKQQIISKKPTENYYIDDKDGKRYYSRKNNGFDENNSTRVIAYRGLGSSIKVDHKGKKIRFAINPGLLHLGRRKWDIALLPNGKELVFSDQKNIYLMDIEKRKVGTIASGTNFMLKTPLFLKKRK